MHPSPHQEQQQPNLLDFERKDVWKEVYNGRWRELSRVQKIMLLVQVLFWVVFSVMTAFEAVHSGGLFRFASGFCLVAAILGAFFFVLSRYIR